MLTTKPFEAYNTHHPYIYWDNFFTEEELLRMEIYFDSLHLEDASVIGNDGLKHKDETIRITEVSMVKPDNENMWIFNKLLQFSDFINSQYYNYDLLGFDYLQYTVYNKEGSHYSYHVDMALGNNNVEQILLPRKLSCSLLLNERDFFDGGELQYKVSDVDNTIEQKRGRAVFFPSFTMHRVTPITRGVRKSLVFWVCGPKFK